MTASNRVEEVFTEFQLTANVRPSAVVSIPKMTQVRYHVMKNDIMRSYSMSHMISQVNQSILHTGSQF